MKRALSRHNIISRIRNSDSWFIVNPLSGNADLLGEEEARALLKGEPQNEEELAAKGYLVDPAEEQRRLREAYLKFSESRATDEIQIFFVPTYACNFACPYCYQSGYEPDSSVSAPEMTQVVEAFFATVDRMFAGKSKYITIFGGEPLLPARAVRGAVEQVIRGAGERKIDVSLVTNGYHLADAVESGELFRHAKIREIQVTLDGPARIHDTRRMLKGNGPTFEKVVAGVDTALAHDLPVNLRVVLDKANISALHEVAALASAHGWTENPLFKTQLGRNYELHYCQDKPGQLHSRISLYEDLYAEIKKHPQILEFHRPAFHVAKFLFDRGELPAPIFDSCPGCKTEWAFDYSGKIYPCTAMVGKKGEEVGTYFPAASLDSAKVSQWEDRDVLSIDNCRECPVKLICGSGCAAIAKNSNGTLHSPDCRPVKEALENGMAIYFEGELP